MSNKSHFFRQSNGDAFIATFRTTSVNESITLPYVSNGTYNGTIDFGDGTVVANTYANRTHTYTTDGFYTVAILGDCVGWNFGLVADSVSKIYDIVNWGIGFQLISSNDGYFQNCVNLDITATDVLDLSNCQRFDSFFRGCNNLVFNNSINNWDTSNIINFKFMFNDCFLFNQPLNNWDTSFAESFNRIFFNSTIFNQDISNWDYSNVDVANGLDAILFIVSPSYNPSYYDNLLIKWDSDPSLGGLVSSAPIGLTRLTVKYTANGASARQSIIDNNKIGDLQDGGQI